MCILATLWNECRLRYYIASVPGKPSFWLKMNIYHFAIYNRSTIKSHGSFYWKSVLLQGGLLVVRNSLAIVLHSGGFKGTEPAPAPLWATDRRRHSTPDKWKQQCRPIMATPSSVNWYAGYGNASVIVSLCVWWDVKPCSVSLSLQTRLAKTTGSHKAEIVQVADLKASSPKM